MRDTFEAGAAPAAPADPTHACPQCKADLSGVIHEQCPDCKPGRPWWTHATKPADAQPTRPMSVRCPRCARDVPVEVDVR